MKIELSMPIKGLFSVKELTKNVENVYHSKRRTTINSDCLSETIKHLNNHSTRSSSKSYFPTNANILPKSIDYSKFPSLVNRVFDEAHIDQRNKYNSNNRTANMLKIKQFECVQS